ncbi:MAG: TolB family protein [Planctomycetota bacterium]
MTTNESKRNSTSSARLLLLLPLALSLAGCLLPGAAHESATRPISRESTDAGESTPYATWQQHSPGDIGEDLYAESLSNGALLYSSNRHSYEYKLYLREPDGGRLERLTEGPGDDAFAAVCPADQRIAFASNRSGTWQLYLMNTFEDRTPERLADLGVEAQHPSWSPDGTRLAYSRRSPVTGEWEIWILTIASHASERVTEGLFPVFSPAGDKLVFQRHRARDAEWFSIWTIDLNGTHEQEIVSGPDWGAVNPDWSPDGGWIVFNSVSKSPHTRADTSLGDDIWCVRRDGTSLRRLTFKRTPEWNPTWSVDGRIFFSATDDSGQTAIWSLRP